MKRLISAALAALMLAGAFVSCGEKDTSSPATTVATTSAEADVYADWLTERLGYAPKDVVLGIGSDSDYTIDMTDFEDDGYILRTVGETTLIFGKTADGLDRAVRAYAKAVEGGYADSLDITYHEGYRVKRLTIAGRDISEYTVYYPETANENMKFAADELVRLIEKATGVHLPVVVGAPVSPAIELCHSTDPALKDEGYVYSVTENGVVIEGAVARGCMYGVWRFLQWELGWDELIFGDSYLNEADHIDIPAGTTRTETPFFNFHEVYAPLNKYTNEKKSPTNVQNSYGAIEKACHGMQNHKFCANVDWAYDQICYTDEDRYVECVVNVEKYIQAQLAAGKTIGLDFKAVDIAQGDNGGYCYCPDCNDIAIEEGYAISAAVVRFANRLADELEASYPGLYYLIFAYQGSNEPPTKTRVNDNVIVTFCYDTNCSNHFLDGSECNEKMYNGRNNKTYDEWLRGWCEMAENVYVWHYSLDNGPNQYTVFDTVYEDMRYLRDIGADGIFTQYEHCELGFRRFEHQITVEMFWNPDMTREEYADRIDNMLRRYYGDGWEFIREYISYLEKAQDLVGCWHCWEWQSAGMNHPKYSTSYYSTHFDDFLRMIDEAMYRANSTEQELRAERLKCHILYMGCYSSYFTEHLRGRTERIAVLEERWTEFRTLMTKNGLSSSWLPTISPSFGGFGVKETLHDTAWQCWLPWYEDICGKLPPENIPE